jgi:hypothetical protein
MPVNPHSSAPRAIGILFASGLLIVFAGMAGLGATAIAVTAASGEGASAQTALHASRDPACINDKYGYADVSGRIVILRRFALGDTTLRKKEGGIFPGHSGQPAGRSVDAAPVAEYDIDPR